MRMQPQTDLFNDKRISVPDNPTLEKEANRLLREVQINPKLLDGNKMVEVDRALWLSSMPLANYFNEGQIIQIKLCISTAPSFETTSRARRLLLEKDLIRVSSKALKDATRHESRISKSLHKGRK